MAITRGGLARSPDVSALEPQIARRLTARDAELGIFSGACRGDTVVLNPLAPAAAVAYPALC